MRSGGLKRQTHSAGSQERPTMFGPGFPQSVEFHICRILDIDSAVLSEQERLTAEKMLPRRKQEFLAGRYCAHRALMKLGMDSCPVLRSRDLLPVWPAAIVGSISHSRGWAVSLVARKEEWAGVGIDIELGEGRYFEGLEEKVCTKEEKSWCTAKGKIDPLKVMKIFSAKESVYKLVNSTFGERPAFHEIELCYPPECEHEPFSAQIKLSGRATPLTLSVYAGQKDDLILTCAMLEAL